MLTLSNSSLTIKHRINYRARNFDAAINQTEKMNQKNLLAFFPHRITSSIQNSIVVKCFADNKRTH